MQFDSMKELDKMCKKLDQGFYQNSKYCLRVHAVYFKHGDKYVNISCRLKNCGFRINHKYETDSKGKPCQIKYYQMASSSHSLQAHEDGLLKELKEVRT